MIQKYSTKDLKYSTVFVVLVMHLLQGPVFRVDIYDMNLVKNVKTVLSKT